MIEGSGDAAWHTLEPGLIPRTVPSAASIEAAIEVCTVVLGAVLSERT